MGLSPIIAGIICRKRASSERRGGGIDNAQGKINENKVPERWEGQV